MRDDDYYTVGRARDSATESIEYYESRMRKVEQEREYLKTNTKITAAQLRARKGALTRELRAYERRVEREREVLTKLEGLPRDETYRPFEQHYEKERIFEFGYGFIKVAPGGTDKDGVKYVLIYEMNLDGSGERDGIRMPAQTLVDTICVMGLAQ